ncbi:hypothetical protein VNO77_03393 [Canavalia gladiata]|uniref:Uncharacterized protein n=1 Tax=Canavalia gladiata TaxID=3824 RepID=A0AAN9R6U2_CANGL
MGIRVIARVKNTIQEWKPRLFHIDSRIPFLGRILRPIGPITKARAKKLQIEVETFLGLHENHPQAQSTFSLALHILD